MRTSRFAALALAALAFPGCWLLSGQFTVSVPLTDPMLLDSSRDIPSSVVDLAANADYRDHRDDLAGLADCAILGIFSNPSVPAPDPGPVDVVVYLTPGVTNHTTAGAVRSDPSAIPIWGPLRLERGQSKRVSWNESAALFPPGGKAALLAEAKGDGRFTLYALGRSGGFRFRVDGGALVLLLDARR